ncbi:hypothetical protein NDU88_009607 [Pleurodeles waltl]|uniref:Uncharacterized protein n=1 Tax=Pleurodeles waltl TaxID=8319 RepID=A0AAV7QV28_PLEWA|nr:hypothetical protein NDU88_009607 [Pleurodeles waltl]
MSGGHLVIENHFPLYVAPIAFQVDYWLPGASRGRRRDKEPEGSRKALTNPRSSEASAPQGVRPVELLHRPESFHLDDPGHLAALVLVTANCAYDKKSGDSPFWARL